MTAPDLCACGQPAATTLHVHYKYPRREYLPEACDPWYVHGGGYHLLTCGDPACEASAYLAVREQIIDDMVMLWPPDLQPSDAQLAGVELAIHEPGDLSWIAGTVDDDESAP